MNTQPGSQGVYDVPEEYQVARKEAAELRAFLQCSREKGAFIRGQGFVSPKVRRAMPPGGALLGTNRDRAVCGVVNKSVNTHAAVTLLTDAGHGDDAMALARVLLESTALLQWMLLDPIFG